MAAPLRRASEVLIRRIASPTFGNAPIAALHGRADRTVGEKAQDTIRDAKEWLKDKGEEVKDKARDVKEWAKDQGETAKDKTRDAREWAKDKGEDMKDKTREAKSWAKDKAYEARERAEDMTDTGKDKLRQGTERVKDVGDEIGDRARDTKERMKVESRRTEGYYRDDEGLKTAHDKSTLEKMSDKVKDAGQAISEKVTEGARKIGLKKD